MPDLEPISGDPFAPQLTPVSGDPFAGSQGIQNETGWMTNPTFQERWEGLPRETQQSIDELSTKEGLENFLHPKNQEMAIQYLLRNNKTPRGWVANQLPQFSPTMDRRTVAEREWETTHQNTDPRYPSLQWQQPSPYPNVSGNRPMPTPFDPDRPEFYNYRVSDESDMTHRQTQPAQPYMHPNVPAAASAVAGFASGGLQGAGVPLPDWAASNPVQRALQNPDIEAAMGMAAPFRGKPITAYHGSPHDFEKFDTSKIGTGEGAQAYGHGLYFAENEGVAKDYQRRLAPGTPDRVRPDEKAIADYKPQWDAIVANRRQAAGHDFRGDTSEYDKQLDALTDQMTKDTLARNPDLLKGKMYQVHIDAEPEHFLDWDKPLNEQSEHVQKALKGIPNIANSRTPDPTGEEIHSLADLSSRDKNGSDVLRQAGIPGIRYLDQGSRFQPQQVEHLKNQISQLEDMLAKHPGKPDVEKALAGRREELAQMQPTHNYVVFNDKIIDILKKYGMAGLVTGGAYHLKTQPVGHDPFAE